MVHRIAAVINIREDAIEAYEQHHRQVWPEVLTALSRANVHNYSIYRWGTTLFSYLEYDGTDYEEDLRNVDAEPVCRRWAELMGDMQVGVPPAPQGKWLELPEVFHLQ